MDEIFRDVRESLKRIPFADRVFGRGPRVAVIRLSGVIADAGARRRGSFGHSRVAPFVDRAFAMKPAAVALIVNSPGGMAAQASLIAGRIRRLAVANEVPVVAFVEDVAASGGYWLACAADEIYAQDSSIVGSVGVISAGFGLDGAIARLGVTRRVHTAGRDKSFLDPFLPEKESDVERLRAVQDDVHAVFRDWVRDRRAGRLKGSDRELFEGAFWTAGPAMERGLIDGIGAMESVMQEKFGEDVRFVDCSPDRSLFLRLFPFGSAAGDAVSDVVGVLEARAVWGRFGL